MEEFDQDGERNDLSNQKEMNNYLREALMDQAQQDEKNLKLQNNYKSNSNFGFRPSNTFKAPYFQDVKKEQRNYSIGYSQSKTKLSKKNLNQTNSSQKDTYELQDQAK